MKELEIVADKLPFRFKRQEKNLMAQTLRRGDSYFTVIVNKDAEARQIDYIVKDKKAKLIFANKEGRLNVSGMTIYPEETMVIEWIKPE